MPLPLGTVTPLHSNQPIGAEAIANVCTEPIGAAAETANVRAESAATKADERVAIVFVKAIILPVLIISR